MRRILRLLAILLLLIMIPGAWAWSEFRAAAGQSRFVAATGGQWAAERIGDVLGRFEAIALRLRPGTTPMENASLTARLLRLEPQLSPATTLFVLSPQLRVVAGSHPVDAELLGDDASAWLRGILDQRSDRVELRAFPNPPLIGRPNYLAVARRLDDAGGGAGIALTFIDQADLLGLIHPAWLRRTGAVRLVDEPSARVITDSPSQAPPLDGAALDTVRRWAEAAFSDQRALVEVPVGDGLRWSMGIDPWTTLAGDPAGLRQRGLLALVLALLVTILTVLASLTPRERPAYGDARAPRGGRAERARVEPAAMAAPRRERDHPMPVVEEAAAVTPATAPATAPAEARGPVGLAEPDDSSQFEDILDSNYVDPAAFDALAREYGTDRASEMLREFIAAADARLPRLANLVVAREWVAFARGCEELVGVTATFGAVRFSETLQRLEQARNSRSPEVDIGSMLNEWRQTKRALLNLVAPDGGQRTRRGQAA
ncbi:MAG: hypothetical protein V4653_04145 [Pseudomonadota bacterium]